MKITAKLRTLSLITLLAFVFNGLLPFFAVYAIPNAYADDQSQFSSLFGDKILICTSTGFKWVSWAEFQSEDHSPKTSNHFKCPLCFTSAFDTKHFIASEKPGYPPAPLELAFKLLPPDQAQLQQSLRLQERLPRAPPLLV